MTAPWRKTVDPYAQVWKAIVDEAQSRGLIHGMRAFEILSSKLSGRSPVDAAAFLAEMVRAGDLLPVSKDLAGAGHSVRAFRGLQYLKETDSGANPDPNEWLNSFPSQSADAHLWTFKAI